MSRAAALCSFRLSFSPLKLQMNDIWKVRLGLMQRKKGKYEFERRDKEVTAIQISTCLAYPMFGNKSGLLFFAGFAFAPCITLRALAPSLQEDRGYLTVCGYIPNWREENLTWYTILKRPDSCIFPIGTSQVNSEPEDRKALSRSGRWWGHKVCLQPWNVEAPPSGWKAIL